MALSFKDSLKKNVESTIVKSMNIAPAVAPMAPSDIAVNDTGIMTLDEVGGITAYSGEDGNWQQDNKYVTYSVFSDDNLSTVSDDKDIVLNRRQFNITQEENSQYIPFEMNRYYDGFDLVNALISIHYQTKTGRHAASRPINVTYNDNKIRFGWLIDAGATLDVGTLEFEIHAYGTIAGNDGVSKAYTWKTKRNKDLNVLESLCDCEDVVNNIDDTWMQELITEVAEKVADEIKNIAVGEQVAAAEQAAETAKQYAESASSAATDAVNAVIGDYAKKEYVDEAIADVDVSKQLEDYALKTYVDEAIKNVDVSEELANYVKTSELEEKGYATKTYVDKAVADVDVSEQLKNYVQTSDLQENYYNKTETEQEISGALEGYATNKDVEDAIAEADISGKLNDYYKKSETYSSAQIDDKLKSVDLSGYATKQYVDNETSALSSSINAHTESILTANSAIQTINQTLETIDKSPNAYYVTTYNEPYTVEGTEYTGENTLVLYKTNETDSEGARVYVTSHEITGGSGGATSSNTITIDRITQSPIIASVNDKVVIDYIFAGTDASGEDIQVGYATWKIGSKTIINKELIKTSVNMENGFNSMDITEYIGVGTDQKVTLLITDDAGSPPQSKTWYVSVVDVRLSSNFNDTKYYTANSPVEFTFTPYGAVDKTVHFLLDGKEIGTKTSSKSAAGLLDAYTIPAQEHGSYLLEIYMSAQIGKNTIESNHIFKDIIWFDDTSDVPVIGTTYQNFTARQYDTTNIEYTVYDPSTETPTVEIAVGDETVSTLTLEKTTNTYTFKTDVVGEHIITITCGKTVKTLKANIVKLDIDVTPVSAGLAFDFNPSGKSNNDADRVWSNGTVSMSVSENFDWVNGGYQYDENGDQYFCVKSGTTAIIDYNLFADDAKTQGKEFKVVFKTANIKNRNTSFISCMNSGIGLDMKVQDANVYSSNGSLYSPYCEEDIIEFEFNINTTDNIPLVMTYEDGVGCRPMIYTSDASFWQSTPQPIVIGSTDCDVHIYRMKAYTRSLSDSEILSNFILDARNADEMVNRYNRNQIYEDKDGVKVLTPEGLAEACPDLRVIIVDAPWFTNDKDNKVDDTTVTMIYKNGRPEDNWTCTGARHSGQGTSSNEYGYAGRNLDLIMNDDISLFKWIDEDGKEVESKTITLTETSVPTNYLNVKVNIASSENQNNAQMARRYNEYNPFVRSAKFNNDKVKDCMEFYNCVIFVRERNEDISTHREFQDCETHFYAIGNVGDSKKTDNTRVNDKNDPKEFVVEITDYNVKLAEFPTGNGSDICAPSDWKAGNTAYDFLYAEYKYKDGKFKSFGSESYEFRYEMKGITEEQREANINAWRDMYKFVVTSTNEEFYSRLKEYFVLDSVLYYYLFTERYTMVDNRAKNSFWHYGKVYITEDEAITLGDKAGGFIVDNEQASINEGYRYDLAFGYDFDTSLGIDNTGKLVLTYGKEDVDYYVDGDPSSSYIYRAAESTFFCRLRDLFNSELQAMFVDRESKNAWSASGLITQWDDAQNQFPEELWRLDIQRKYLRTYLGTSIDNSIVGAKEAIFLPQMMNGRKKYQRRMFERNQELYMATKYFGTTATQDQIRVRFNNPESYVVKPDFTLYITPYSDMYIGVSFYNGHKDNFRAKAGIEYSVRYPEGLDTADITLIYGASFIQAIGDLSKCYIGDNDFTKATRLQSLVIGSDVDGYANSYMAEIKLANNRLLEYLDVRNITGLSSTIDLSQCGNMLELRAEGSGAKGVIFANGGKIKKFYLPSIASLTAKNLNNIEDFNIESYINLQTLVVENTPAIDTHEIIETALDIQLSLPEDSAKLNVLRLIGIDWDIDSNEILEEVILLRGQNSNGGEIEQSVLAGTVTIPTIGEYDKQKYEEVWSDLTIIPKDGVIPQYKVTFRNDDGTELDVQYIDQYGNAVNPITREENPIATPTKESTIQYSYTFTGWDKTFTNIVENIDVYATYEESLRDYTIQYVSMGNLVYTASGKYGDNIVYNGSTPTYTLAEPTTFYLFNRWDKSGFLTDGFDENGVKTVTAIFDKFGGNSTHFNNKDLKDLTPVEIYAMNKLNLAETVIKKDAEVGKNSYNIVMGNDVEYDDIESQLLIDNGVYLPTLESACFDGSNYIDTGIQLFNEDKDFVLAMDYEFLSNNNLNAVLAQCHKTSALNSSGFKLWYGKDSGFDGVKFTWEPDSDNVISVNKREMMVIRHKKGDNNLYIYKSNLDGYNVNVAELTSSQNTTNNATLVFGASNPEEGYYENKAKGNIYWAKIWYADLGEDVCKDLAMWIHESVTLEACGFRQYYLADGSEKRCSFSMLASHLLGKTVKWNPTNTNDGGWAESSLNTLLNTRLYNAMPTQIKSLLKKVIVWSNDGIANGAQQYTTVTPSECYIAIPAAVEVDASKTITPYISEGSTFWYMSDKSARRRAFDGGDYHGYWLRSPAPVNGSTNYPNYIWHVDKNGDMQAITNASGSSSEGALGILMVISF